MSNNDNGMARFVAKVFVSQTLAKVGTKKNLYSDSFRSLEESAVIITRSIGKKIISRKTSPEEKAYLCHEWLRQMSNIYGIDCPSFEVIISEDKKEKNGIYDSKNHHIKLINKISLVTLMHEFRHAMQYSGFRLLNPDIEEDARSWSMSMFKHALPKHWKKACENNKVLYK